MSREYKAISRVIKSGNKTVQKTGVWTAIHEETGCGTVSGRNITFNDTELDRLRRYAISRTGLDPLFDSTEGSRIDLAAKTADEKLAQNSVFGDLVVMAALGSATLPVSDKEVEIPPGTVLSVPIDQIKTAALTERLVLVVENGAIMPECHKLRLPQSWTNAIVIYRGHGANAKHVAALVHNQPSDKLGLFYDFDPEGLSMALSFGKGQIFIPETLPSSLPNKRSTFRNQLKAMKRLGRLTENSPSWANTVQIMEFKELAIMQEHMLTHEVDLSARPPLASQPSH